jgi:hypothetical protein
VGLGWPTDGLWPAVWLTASLSWRPIQRVRHFSLLFQYIFWQTLQLYTHCKKKKKQKQKKKKKKKNKKKNKNKNSKRKKKK